MKVVQYMYEDREAVLRCAVRVTDGFEIMPRLNSELLLVCNGDEQVVR